MHNQGFPNNGNGNGGVRPVSAPKHAVASGHLAPVPQLASDEPGFIAPSDPAAGEYGRQHTLTVYLAGPVAGKSYSEATCWRREAAERLRRHAPHIRCLDPMRAKEELRGVTAIKAGEGGSVFSPKLTVARDLWDVARCDVVLLNLLDAAEPSIGSMVELGHAAALRKLIIVILPDDRTPEAARNPHDHPFVRQTASAVVGSLEEALRVLEST